jgi:hypothetical protein
MVIMLDIQWRRDLSDTKTKKCPWCYQITLLLNGHILVVVLDLPGKDS